VCTTCGCSDHAHATLTDLETGRQSAIGSHDHHHHDHGHHRHDHDHGHHHGTTVALEQAVLAKNDRLAERNRGWLEGRGVLALNLMSSPGAGKTTLLERTIRALGGEIPISVIEGDQETLADAQRIRATGCRVVQVNTGTGCHLDAEMIASALKQLAPPQGSVVMIENVGNLVCPALFDLGERTKVVILSVTEGDDKPQKYPHMFRAADLMILNKIDLLPHVDFDVDRCLGFAHEINPGLAYLQLSARTGEGLDAWCAWLRRSRNPLPEPDLVARPPL
jgi:hydrogenase nickel incorporation protein HypB